MNKNGTLLLTFEFSGRDGRYKKWKMAVQRSLGWAAVKMSDHMTGKDKEAEKINENLPTIIDDMSLRQSAPFF